MSSCIVSLNRSVGLNVRGATSGTKVGSFSSVRVVSSSGRPLVTLARDLRSRRHGDSS